MFRKPKSKGTIRQRTATLDENDEVICAKESVKNASKEDSTALPEEEEEDQLVSTKPPSLLSFDHDEGADSNFEIKKSKKYVREQKRQKRMEGRAALEARVKKEVVMEEEEEEDNAVAHQHLSPPMLNIRMGNVKGEDESVESPEEDDDQPADVVRVKFSSAFGGIPDSRAVFEARKRRERLRKEGQDSSFIPLDEDKKLRTKGERSRLLREDDNDDSDEDSSKFYSRSALLRGEEERRREEELDFLRGQDALSGDDEMEEWEKQQISKAVSNRAIGQLRNEYRQTSAFFRGYDDLDDKVEVGMDLDIDEEALQIPSFQPREGNSSARDLNPVTMADVLNRLKLRVVARDDALNTRRAEVASMEGHLEENEKTEKTLRAALPHIESKYHMLQRLKVYGGCLLDCLNEKVAEANQMSDQKRGELKARRERLVRRRRKDIRDSYEECAAAAAGRIGRTGEMAVRAAEREGRRARRRRAREALLALSHHDGLSSDDEEAPSQTVAHKEQIAKINETLTMLFTDTHEEYSSLRTVLPRVLEWLAVDEKSFRDAYASLCLPKLASPYIRQQLSTVDILGGKARLEEMEWYEDALKAAEQVEALPTQHPFIVGLVPACVEKVVLPFLYDVIADEWDALSLTESVNLSSFLRQLIADSPTLSAASKALRRVLEAILVKFNEVIDEDLFVPMYGKQALETASTGCKAFLDRQFWVAIKLLRCVNAFTGVLSLGCRSELLLSAASRVAVLCLQQQPTASTACTQSQSLLAELSSALPSSSPAQARGLRICLTQIAEHCKDSNRALYRELRKTIEQLEKISA